MVVVMADGSSAGQQAGDQVDGPVHSNDAFTIDSAVTFRNPKVESSWPQIENAGPDDATWLGSATTLDGCKVRFHNPAVSSLWMGGKPNNVAEEFALRMNRETGCLLADVDCGRVIDPGKLAGLNGQGMDDSSAARDR